MAVVDFSNAVLNVFEGNQNVRQMKPFENSDIALNSPIIKNMSGTDISRSYAVRTLRNTPTVKSYLYTGTLAESGTEFLIGNFSSSVGVLYASWKVSNISFSSGDTYAFVVDVEVSGNT